MAVVVLLLTGMVVGGGVSPARAAVTAGSTTHAAPVAAQAAPVEQVEQVDQLDRGLVVLRSDEGNFLSWRLLASDPENAGFDVYRGSVKVNDEPLTEGTNFTDADGPVGARYTVRLAGGSAGTLAAAREGVTESGASASALAASSTDIPIQKPAGGTTPDGVAYTYAPGDASVGDLNGDGTYEIVLKWDPSNAKDNSQSGYTGNVFIDAYTLTGTRLWRIDLGRNIRAGAHYTQFQVFDYDGDGKAEVAMKTADATVDGTGVTIGSSGADYRNSSGYILSGPEYLTVFAGPTGKALATADYVPARGTVSSWGDSYGNRVDRFLAGTAYINGTYPSIIMARGYYTRSVIAAWDFRNGTLTRKWTFDSSSSTNGSAWTGQGNHQLSIADVDSDGKDEILYGAMAVDDNGSGLWVNGQGHGDAYHVGDLIPSRAGLEVFKVDEDTSKLAAWMADARTGAIIWSNASCGCDNGRGVSDDIYGGSAGAESWSSGVSGLYNTSGTNIGRKPSSTNFVIWWDGDAQRELLDSNHIDKYGTSADTRLLTGDGVTSINGTKATPSLQADILGDWREEVIWSTTAGTALRIYSTTDSTSISHVSLMQDRMYREAVAWQNTAYNQPPHTSFAIGS
ncbi:rhamnogalacturonan lyase [Kineosporia sp. J2-2]|uniref:Rhamnogalacturonan lyase n=1 Tax=Kineosporia corallincola TaxID=2835133 RepID=A0ABS5TBN6_9ACTN|nr:rhamnogalacturonan lyase [Kineosporia corallincola]MBT0768484.1 rhamnogalacturonan lyase [Kineosporia corallincola]